MTGYDLFSYCGNNPVNFIDTDGKLFFTVLFVSLAVGAVVGGTIGGVVAYNQAKLSGNSGSDLFYETLKGVGIGMTIGGLAGALVGTSIGIAMTLGAVSVGATAFITTTAKMVAKTVEVAALQIKKSKADGDNNWQIANDCMNSIYDNGFSITFSWGNG